MDEKIILHGNHARIDKKRKIVPEFINYVPLQLNESKTDAQLEDDADFARDTVNANHK